MYHAIEASWKNNLIEESAKLMMIYLDIFII